MKSIKFSLAWQILFAMVLGILLGSYLHYHSDSRDWLVVNLLSPAGDIFIHLIKMIVVPIVISTLVWVSRVLVMPNSSGVLARKPLFTSR